MKNNYPCVIVIKNFLNPKVHQNCISGSKVAAFLLKGWILPTGGSSAVHKTFVSLNKFNKTTATFRWPLSSMCSHMSLQIITGKILLLYVFAYVSSDDHFREILPNTPCKKRSISYGCVAICVFRLLPRSNSAPHSLQLNGISSHILLCALNSHDFRGSMYTQKYCHTLRTGGSDLSGGTACAWRISFLR